MVPAELIPEIAWTATQMRAGARIVVDEALIAAYQAASSPHSIRALKCDLEA
ncbi:MAG: integrase, partial [Novosphingobium sp.]